MLHAKSGFVIPLNHATRQETSQAAAIGGKASGLLRLIGLGFRVPAGFVVSSKALTVHLEGLGVDVSNLFTTGARQTDWQLVQELLLSSPLEESLLAPILTSAANLNASSFAVRSSGALEDGVTNSFAGLFESTLNVSLEHLETAIKTTWASLFSERVHKYMTHGGFEPVNASFSIVIQKQITPVISGVGFSVDPVRGHDNTLTIEVCDGLGDRLVGGMTDPLRLHYNWQQEEFIHAAGALSPEGVKLLEAIKPELAESLLQLQRRERRPVDIEWCADAEGLHFLQLRPITRVSFGAVQSEWTTADFKDGGVASGPCTQVMWSLYQDVFNHTMPAYLRRVGLIKRSDTSVASWAEMHFGRPYWNVGAVKEALARLPGFVERDFDKDLGIEPSYEGQGITTPLSAKTLLFGLLTLRRIKSAMARAQKAHADFVPQGREQAESYRRLPLSDIADDALYAHFKAFYVNCFKRAESTYFTHIYNTSNAMTLFKEKLRSLRYSKHDLGLYGGLDNVAHNDLNIALWRLSRAIRRDDLALSVWQLPTERLLALYNSGDHACELDHFRALVDRHGYHATRELDLLVPRYCEDVTPLIDHVKAYLKLPDEADPLLRISEQALTFEKAKQEFLDWIPFRKRRSVTAQLTQLRHLMWLREELRDISVRHYLVIRLMLNEMARRADFSSVLVEPNDIYFLRIEEILDLIDKKRSSDELRDILAKAKTYYYSFYDFQAPNEIGRRHKLAPINFNASTAAAWQGIPCSSGRRLGVARVIKDVTDVGRLRKDDILVTRFTDPAWTPTFGLISGVVTETGGVLSHAAVIAREYGIPAVLGVNAATRQIKDGDVIIIDGDTGAVTMPEATGEAS